MSQSELSSYQNKDWDHIEMSRYRSCFKAAVWVKLFAGILLVVLLLFAEPSTAREITVIGVVNEMYQIVSEGEIFEVEKTNIGDELVINHLGEKVKVTGTVKEEDGMKLILIKGFKALEE